ncbi:MAG: universal stress protein [Chloroflexi bacterium]|nr:universal stress protein [Chloroflexota bacterium]
MFTKLLVPLDGSRLAERALPYAEALAQASGARLVLVRATLARVFPGIDPTRAQVQAVEEAEAYLADVAARLTERGLASETAVPYGEAAQGILDEIRLRGVGLVVMATHGRSGLDRWIYGSVAKGVLVGSPAPVLLVRAWQQEGPSLATHPRLLVPLDGSDFATAALPVAEGLARALDGQLVLLHVAPVPDRVLTADGRVVAYLVYGREATALEQQVEALTTEAQHYLSQVASRLGASSSPVQLDVRVGSPAEAIAAAGREHGAAMVVMATHGRTGLGRLVFGSVPGAVLRQGNLPLLLVRPPALSPTDGQPLTSAEEQEVGARPVVSLSLGEDEVVLLRTALETLEQTASRHEHLQGRIRRLLARLPTEGEVATPSAAP